MVNAMAASRCCREMSWWASVAILVISVSKCCQLEEASLHKQHPFTSITPGPAIASLKPYLRERGNPDQASPAAGGDCLPRAGAQGHSNTCVCSAEYCDTLERQHPAPQRFVQITSSREGLRFNQRVEEVDDVSWTLEDDLQGILDGHVVLRVNTSMRYQTIEGFGGSVTDAASYTWQKLSKPTQKKLMESYFSEKGLEYNLIRTPIGGADFSHHPYAYNELPLDDVHLRNFSLTMEDFYYKMPMIRMAQDLATDEVKLMGTVWSPPLWMKTNNAWQGFSRIKFEYNQTFADYHIKFLEHYKARGFDFWAITTTNEPINGVIPFVRFNSLGWTPSTQADWLVNNLGPTIRASEFKDIKIFGVDDQRYIVLPWFLKMVQHNSKVLEYIDGIAIHYYGNFAPPGILSNLHNRFENLTLISTEACEGAMPWNLEKVILGSWTRAQAYIRSIMQDLNNWVVGWIDWNLCLDPQGGPNWANNFVDAPILVFEDTDEFIKQPMFYAMGHFSKFVPRGSVRLHVNRRSLRYVRHLAFLTPRGTIVSILHNTLGARTVHVVVDEKRRLRVEMPEASIVTVEFEALL